MRGIAALAVFLFHFVCVSGDFINSKLAHSIFYYGKYGVQFFFVISGFVITYSMIKGGYTLGKAFIFFKKRIIRVEPPYLVVLCLTVCLLYLKSYLGLAKGTEQIPGISQILLHVGYLIPFSKYEWLSIVFWTLAIEFQFYLIFSVLFIAFAHSVWLRSIVIASLIVLYLFETSGQSFFYWSPIFMLGILLAFYKVQKLKAWELLLYSIVLGAFIYYKLGFVNLVFTIIPFLIIYLNPALKSRVLTFFGDISYSLYLIHTLIAFTIINLSFRFGVGTGGRIAFGFFAIALTILGSYLLYLFVEKPFKKRALEISYKS
ncbi:acyltransferase family protein [Longitalea arenae]|uniref:acyltransferase family protein n=1 Tax=Longitalea arenae TaxID=2812558 RepID=UPI001966DB07|nr:acyltransferase [Longitalea arenae]